MSTRVCIIIIQAGRVFVLDTVTVIKINTKNAITVYLDITVNFLNQLYLERIMLPLFLLVSMAILGCTSFLGIVLNSMIVSVNYVQKEKGKSLGPSDLILVTLGISNITFQVVMTANDLMIILASDLYYSDGVCTTIKVLLFIPIFSSFWFTVCLCVYYCLQIVIFTHPFLMRLKMGIAKLVPCFLVTSFFVAVIISIPVFWSTYIDPISENFSSNHTLQLNAPKLSMTYLLPTSIIGSSVPLLLVAIANGLILKSLRSPSTVAEKAGNIQSTRTEARGRAARTVGSLLLLYTSFYISELLMFASLFPPNSPGFCACLMVIYTYSPIQSLILILGSPKLKKVLLSLFQISAIMTKKTETIKTVC